MYIQFIILLWFFMFLVQGAFIDNILVSMLFKLLLAFYCMMIPIMWLGGIHLGLTLFGSICGIIFNIISHRDVNSNMKSFLYPYTGAITGGGIAFAIACVISTVCDSALMTEIETMFIGYIFNITAE